HAAKMGQLGAFLGKSLVMELPRGNGVEAQVELILPAEFEARLAQGIVTNARGGMPFGEVGCVRGNLVGNDSILHILLVWAAERLLGRFVAEQRATVPADHRGADGAGDMVVARRDIRR